MAYRMGRSALLIATALTATSCQTGPVKKAMNPKPALGAGRAMLQARVDAATEQQVRLDVVGLAEHTVRSAPDSVDARKDLAKAYFDAGRFRSAAQAYDDALAVAPGDDSLRLKKALALLAQGNQAGALAELDRVRDSRDAGLAYALAGKTDRAVQLLGEAARESTADARTRQNLALAYALDGQWAQARTVAAQDLDPANVQLRIRQWAEFASSADTAAQTASLVGIASVTSDEGRPIGLAYVPPSARVVQQAAAAPPPEPAAPVETIQVAALPPETIKVAAVPPAVAVAPETREAVKLTLASAPAAPPPTAVDRLLPEKARNPEPRKAGASASRRWVVQLGAYDNANLLESNWRRLARGNAELLGGFDAVRSEVTIGQRVFHRLAVAGFDSRSSAIDLCETLQSKGRDCFVRSLNPTATQLARVVNPARAS